VGRGVSAVMARRCERENGVGGLKPLCQKASAVVMSCKKGVEAHARRDERLR
jgi:hypothetical protein